MLIITQETDFVLTENCAIYFYMQNININKKINLNITKIENECKINFLCVDVENFKEISKRYSIVSVPTIILIKNYKEIKRITKVLKYQDLKKDCGRVILNKD